MLWKREPVLLMGAVQAFIGLLVAFGLHLSVEQVGALVTATGAVLSVVTRRYVAPMPHTAAAPTPVPAPAPANTH